MGLALDWCLVFEHPRLGLAGWLLFHVLSAACMAVALWLASHPRSRDEASAWGWLTAAHGLCIPMVGGPACLFAYLITMARKGHSGSLLQTMRELEIPDAQEQVPAEDNSGNEGDDAGEKAVEEKIREMTGVEPISVTLDSADIPAIQTMIDTLAQSRQPEMLKLLYRCLEDERPEIFQYALTTIAKLQEKFCLRIYQAVQAERLAPESVETHLALVQCYWEYLESGLLDSTLEDYYGSLAITGLERTLKLRPEHDQSRVRLGRLLQRRGRHAEAERVFRTMILDRPQSLEAHLGVLEVLFREGQGTVIGPFRDALAEARIRAVVPPDLTAEQRELVDYWLQRSESA